MPENKNRNEALERIMNHLADSVLALSDEAMVAEVIDSGGDPVVEAEKTGNVLQQASQILEQVTERLSGLGHRVNANYWCRVRSAYHNNCLKCGMAVSFRTKTGEILGRAAALPCAATGEYRVAKMVND